MFKPGSYITVAYDENAFHSASRRLWQATDVDAINPFGTNLELNLAGERGTFYYRLVIGAQDEPILVSGAVVTVDSTRSIEIEPIALPPEHSEYLERYSGFPITIQTLENSNAPISGNPMGYLKMTAWLGGAINSLGSQFYVVDYEGNPIVRPANLAVGGPFQIVNGPDDIYFGDNLFDGDNCWIINKPNRLDSNNTRQPSMLLGSDGNLAANIELGSIRTNTAFIDGGLERTKEFGMQIDASQVGTTGFETINNKLIEITKHVINGRIRDRTKAGFGVTPLYLANKSIDGLFEIPKASGRFYNLTDFVETATEDIMVAFESV